MIHTHLICSSGFSSDEFDESYEIMEEIQKIKIPQAGMGNSKKFNVGDVVRWAFEAPQDYLYGSLYIVVGFDAEKVGVVVTRVIDNPYLIKEFHVSQLAHV